MSKQILADELVKSWAEALGVDIPGDHVRRIVIDAEHGCPVMIYVERYGDERLLEIEPPSPAEVEIRGAS